MFLLYISLKYPIHQNRVRTYFSMILLYKIYAVIIKTKYEDLNKKHPDLTSKSLLIISKTYFEENFNEIFNTVMSNSNI